MTLCDKNLGNPFDACCWFHPSLAPGKSAHVSLSRGDVIAGRYEVEQLLEQDGAIEIYRARHLIAGSRVWLKVASASCTWPERRPDDAGRLLAVQHEALFAPSDGGRLAQDRWFVAVPPPTGGQLKALAVPQPTPRVLSWGKSLGGALAALHQAGWVHGHLRPERVMVGEDSAQLLDGIATRGSALAGNAAALLAPELVGGAAPNEASDIFALGMTLAGALAGHFDFGHDARVGTLLSTLFGLRPWIDTTNGEADRRGLASLLASMLASEPFERPTARQVEAVCHQLLAGEEPEEQPPPSTRLELEGRRGQALGIVAIKPPGAKYLSDERTAEWRHAVSSHGARIVNLIDGSWLCVLERGTAGAIPMATAFCAKTTLDMLPQAGAVAALLLTGGEDDLASPVAAEITLAADLLALTPAGSARLTPRLADRSRGAILAKPSGGAFVYRAPDQAKEPRTGKGGTLEMDLPDDEEQQRTLEVDPEAADIGVLEPDTHRIDDDPYRRPTREVDLSAAPVDPVSESDTPTVEVPVDPRVLDAMRREANRDSHSA